MPFDWDTLCIARGYSRQPLAPLLKFEGDGRTHNREYPSSLEPYRYSVQWTVANQTSFGLMLADFLTVGLARAIDWTPPDGEPAARFVFSSFTYTPLANQFWRVSATLDSVFLV